MSQLSISAHASGSSGLSLWPGFKHCVVFLGQDTLLSQCLFQLRCMNASVVKNLHCKWYLKILSKLYQPLGFWSNLARRHVITRENWRPKINRRYLCRTRWSSFTLIRCQKCNWGQDLCQTPSGWALRCLYVSSFPGSPPSFSTPALLRWIHTVDNTTLIWRS